MVSAGGNTFDAAARGRAWSSWSTQYRDELEVWTDEGDQIGARGEDLEANNPVATAMVGTIIDQTLGARGLQWRSAYQADPDGEVTDADKIARQQIDRFVAAATAGTRWDAAGQRTTRDLAASVIWSSLVPGNGWCYRVWKPNRGGDPRTGFCCRVVHPRRIRNPGHSGDRERRYHGIELDSSGDPIAVHIKQGRATLSGGRERWERIPYYGPDGLRTVCHLRSNHHPDSIMGYSYLAPMAQILKVEDNLVKTYLVAKQVQASFPVIIETDDVKTIKHAMRRNCFIGDNNERGCATRWQLRPNRVYYARKGTMHTFPALNFNGQDITAFLDAMIGIACAGAGLPIEVVMKKLGKANLASARTALADAWRTTMIYRHRFEEQVANNWSQWIIWEGVQRGVLDLEVDDRDALFAGAFKGPTFPSPDKARDATAARTVHEIGASRSAALQMVGIDYADDLQQEATDRQQERAVLGAERGPAKSAAGRPPGRPADRDDDEPDDEPDDDDEETDEETD